MTDDAPGAWAVVRRRWRGWLRAVHRDLGYLAVGFTLIYAISGLAMNHVEDWDPNFVASERSGVIEPIDPALDDAAAVAVALERLGLAGAGAPQSTFRAGDELHLEWGPGRKIVIIGEQFTEQRQRPRVLLRVLNWLHAQRGKDAWKYVADAYAVMLLYLAVSGLFMIKGRLGLRWRGAVLVAVGVAVPVAYVAWSGGPGAKSGDAGEAAEASAR